MNMLEVIGVTEDKKKNLAQQIATLSCSAPSAGSVCGWCRGNGAVMYPQLQECHHCDGTGVTPNDKITSGENRKGV